jgi:hypothetical protein
VMNHKKNHIILLTATIRPPAGVPGLHRIDPADRMKDYLIALEFYCSLPQELVSRIVLIENSEADLAPLCSVVEKANALDRVELLSFNGLDHPPSYGRGYGEFKLLDHAIGHSATLAVAHPSSILWKITGRYRVLNAMRLIREAPTSFDIYCDIRNWPIPWVDLRIFGCSLDGYRKCLWGIFPQLREDIINMAPEQHLHAKINELARSHEIVTRFKSEPLIDGFRGKDSKNYISGLNFVKYVVRACERKFIP